MVGSSVEDAGEDERESRSERPMLHGKRQSMIRRKRTGKERKRYG